MKITYHTECDRSLVLIWSGTEYEMYSDDILEVCDGSIGDKVCGGTVVSMSIGDN